MSNIAHEMLRMYGLSMGLDVNSDQRVQKIREIREQEMQAIAEGTRKPSAEPAVVLKRRPAMRRAIKDSTSWFPFKSKTRK